MPMKKTIFISIAIFFAVIALLVIGGREWAANYLGRTIHAEILRAVEDRFDGRAETSGF